MERPEAPPRVVEDAVEDDLHAAPVGRIEERPEGLVASQERVHPLVVEGVVTVVRGRGEDRVQVDRARPQALDVVHALDDPGGGRRP